MPRRKIENSANDPAPAAKRARVAFELPVGTIPTRSGTLLACGQGGMGQLGLGEDKTECTRPVIVREVADIVDIAAGGMHSLCLTKTGDIYSFGCNDEGALGRDTSEEGSEFVPRKIELPGKCVKMSAGDSHSACLLEDGSVFAWGSFRDSHGNMGLTVDGNSQSPIHILPKVKANDISSGADHLVVLACNGHVYTLGCAEQGQLGRVSLRDGSGETRRGKSALLKPDLVKAKLNKQFSAIWTTTYSTFIRDSKNEKIYAFGLNNYLQLGVNIKTILVSVPRKTNLEDVRSIAGGQHHTLVLKNDNKCDVIGRRDYGRLGLGELSEDITTLTPLKALENTNLIDISCGEAQSFAITSDGKVYAWGMGSNLSLGTGEEDDEPLPVLINSKQTQGKNVLKVVSGGQHSLFLVANEEIVNNTVHKKDVAVKNIFVDNQNSEPIPAKLNGNVPSGTKGKGRKRKN